MSSESESSAELAELLTKLFDQYDDRVDVVALNAMLIDSAESRAIYRRYVQLHATLQFNFRPRAIERPVTSSERDYLKLVAESAFQSKRPSELRGKATVVSMPLARRATRSVLNSSWFYTSIAALVFYAAFGLIIWPRKVSTDHQIAVTHERTPSNRDDGVARLVSTVDADWRVRTGEQRPTLGKTLATGESLELQSGMAVFQFSNGAIVSAQGPIKLVGDRLTNIRVDRGRVAVHVPPSAKGFSVETPSASIVDLGTEFGVDVVNSQQTKVVVAKGKVQLFAKSERQQSQGTLLSAGQSVLVSSDAKQTREVAIPHETTWVEQALLAVNREVQSSPSSGDSPYLQRILKTPDLVSHWRLDEDGKRGATDEVGRSERRPLGKHHGTLLNLPSADLRRPGAIDNDSSTAIRFNGVDSCLAFENFKLNAAEAPGLTVAAWIKPEQASQHALLVGAWHYEAVLDCFGLFLLDDSIMFSVGDGRVSENYGIKGNSGIPITPGKYYFVVGSWERASRHFRLYVNGRRDPEVRTQEGSGLNVSPNTAVTVGGQATNRTRYFAGCIDEISIFARTLSDSEISELYEIGSGPVADEPEAVNEQAK